MKREHDHLLDGHLHDVEGCPMCVEIRRLIAVAKIESSTSRALDQYGEIARVEAKRRRGREP